MNLTPGRCHCPDSPSFLLHIHLFFSAAPIQGAFLLDQCQSRDTDHCSDGFRPVGVFHVLCSPAKPFKAPRREAVQTGSYKFFLISYPSTRFFKIPHRLPVQLRRIAIRPYTGFFYNQMLFLKTGLQEGQNPSQDNLLVENQA